MQENIYNELISIILSDLSKDEIRERLENYHASDIADALEEVTTEQRLKVYAALGIENLFEIFSFYEDVEKYISEVEPEIAADIIEKMDSNEAVEVLNELDEKDKEEIFELMEDDSKQIVTMIDSYSDEVIGSYMSDNFIVIKNNLTIKQAMASMVNDAGKHDNIFTLYVVNENNQYYGAIALKELICARKEDRLIDLCMTYYPSFYDDELMDECINKLKDYSETSIPVLNRNKEIVGVITSDILIDATEEQMEEDYAKLAGLSESEDLDEGIFDSIKKRIPWLIILLFLGLFVSSVIGVFEGVIATLPVMVFFQSMILDMSGNVGTQSLAVTIRNISNDELNESGNKLRNVLKEVQIGFLNGVILAIISFAFTFLYMLIRKQEVAIGEGFLIIESLKVSGIISLSLLVAMTLSSFIGTIFPIILNKLKIDPAVASGPFITTMNDIVAVVTYYGLTFLCFRLLS